MPTLNIVDSPIEFYPPLVNPTGAGLFNATIWDESGDGPDRFLHGGVRVRTTNYGEEGSSGVWDAPWCGAPTPSDAKKDGERPEFPDPFEPITAWAFDMCDLSELSRAEIRAYAQQWLRLTEQISVERQFAARMLADLTPTTASGIVATLGKLEGELASTNTLGFIHASPSLAADAAYHQLIVRTGTGFKTPMGNTWVFGGGYYGGSGLGSTLVATSQPFGWRGSPQLREADVKYKYNQFIAVAERSFVVGYEAAIAAVTIT